MVNHLFVEVEQFGALFEASIIDVEGEENVKVRYRHFFKQEETVPRSKVKLPWYDDSEYFEKGQKVEIYYNRVDLVPYGAGWWPASVLEEPKSPKNDEYLIRLKNSGGQKVLVEKRRIRTSSLSLPVGILYKIFIAVPKEYEHLAARRSVQEKFQKLSGVPFCQYISGHNVLKTICFAKSRDEKVTEKDLLRDLSNLWNVMEEDSTEHQDESSTAVEKFEEPDTRYYEKFTIPQHLVGLAFGTRGHNVEQVREICGTTRVHFDEKNLLFKIHGTCEKTVRIARNLLEYSEEQIKVPKDFSEFLEDRKGEVITDIINKSGLVRIELEPVGSKSSPDYVLLNIVGIKGSISEAKLLIESEHIWWKTIYKKAGIKTGRRVPTPRTEPKLVENDRFCEMFHVDKEVYEIVKNRRETSMQLARTIMGIVSIDEEDSGDTVLIKITGETTLAVAKARNLLEFVEDTSYHVPKYSVGKLIGKGGYQVRDIMHRSGVVRIDVLESIPRCTDGKIPVKLIGQLDKIKKARRLITDVLNER